MIFTLTLNPSLDYFLFLKDFRYGQTNRADHDVFFPAGKGINVSLMLKKLGFESKMLGFLAGFSGVEIQKKLKEFGIQEDFIFLPQGYSRINVKISSQQESEINAKGPFIFKENISALCERIKVIQSQDFLVLSGSLPQGLPSNFYASLMKECKSQKIILDCAGEAMQEALSCKPFLIKPNRVEIEEIFGLRDAPIEDLKRAAKSLQEMGAQNVLVSMGGEGAFLLAEDFYFCRAPKGKVLNSIGAGDSMVAGIIAGLTMGFELKKAFFYSVACGSASAFSESFAEKKEVDDIFKSLIKEEQ